MAEQGWDGSHDFIKASMKYSMDNAEGIVDYYKNKVTQHQLDDPGILNLKNLVTPKAVQFIDLCGKYSGDVSGKLAQTSAKDVLIGDMRERMTAAKNIVIPVHGLGTLEYEIIYAGGLDDLYNGTYNQVIARLLGIANKMTLQSVPAAALYVNNYRTEIMNRHTSQQNDIQMITDDSILMKSLVVDLGRIINCGRGWLIFHFGGIENYETTVDSYFPLNLLRTHSTGHYQRIIPAAEFRRMCIHIFKPGERAELIVGDKDVWVSTAEDANHPQATGYHALAGSNVTIDPLLMGDPLKKYVIATNVDLTDSTDLIFNIIKP